MGPFVLGDLPELLRAQLLAVAQRASPQHEGRELVAVESRELLTVLQLTSDRGVASVDLRADPLELERPKLDQLKELLSEEV